MEHLELLRKALPSDFSPLSFFNLPRELRDLIYWYYLKEDDGYLFHYASGKIRGSNNQPVDLALMYTCKSIAAEMRNKPLEINEVTFRTVYTDSGRIKAGYFHHLHCQIAMTKSSAVFALNESEFHSYCTSDTIAKVDDKFPTHSLLLREMLGPSYCFRRSWFETGSMNRAFDNYVLKVISEGSDFLEAVINRVNCVQRNLLRSPTLFSKGDPWIIPTTDEFADLAEDMFHIPHIKQYDDEPTQADFWERIKYRYSAASAAITFLKSISPQARMQFRKILIYEDHVSVAFPESHALGLIPYCLENSSLRIERRVNIWRNLLRSGSRVDLWRVTCGTHDHDLIFRDRLDAWGHNISGGFALWMQEALLVADHGMPPDSFKLVFDGHPAPEQSSQLFDIVKTTAAWRIASDLWCSRRRERKVIQIYFFEEFARVVKNITKGDSFISCNFPVGELPDIQPFDERSRSWTHTEFRSEMNGELIRMRFQTEPPLPPWRDLQLEEVLPEDQVSSEEVLAEE